MLGRRTGRPSNHFRTPVRRPAAQAAAAPEREVAGPAGTGTEAPVVPRPMPARGGMGRAERAPTAATGGADHALARPAEDERLHAHEAGTREAFDRIEPVLRRIAGMRDHADFERRAQAEAEAGLGFQLPEPLLKDAWIRPLDVPGLYAHALFETYRRWAEAFFREGPLAADEGEREAFRTWLHECGFHALDLSPCSDGRLAHAIRYVLRLPVEEVRRKSFAGALFDIENGLQRWIRTELGRYRHGEPNGPEAGTRYLKVAVYHFSSRDPEQGCAAHGSDTVRAMEAAIGRLRDLRAAVDNTYCCGEALELLLIGMDTDTDAVRIHPPGTDGLPRAAVRVEAADLFEETADLAPEVARERIRERVAAVEPTAAPGLQRLVAGLMENNIAQIGYVRRHHGGHYADAGHKERFMAVGRGFEEVQLRNLTYFAYLNTVEEGAPDLDVGVKIFSGLNVRRGLPVPVIVRFDYDGQVPGARERAGEQAHRVEAALRQRYPELVADGRLHTFTAVRDMSGGSIEVLGSSVEPEPGGEGH
ncbi:MAG: carboxysome shell carbonic anhydrase [Pseudomonadota bacterium]